MKRNILNIISWIIGLGALMVLIYKIYQTSSRIEILNLLHKLSDRKNLFYLAMCVALMPVNWLIECVKWFKVANLVEKINFITSVKSVLTGLAFGHLLPGRSSEFFGKILFFSEKNRNNISVLHFVNGAFQMYVTLVAGMFFLIFYFDIEKAQEYKILLISASVLIFIVLSSLIVFADKLNFLKRFLSNLNYQTPPVLKIELIVWSVIRYLVFVLQFYLVFLSFNLIQNLDLNFISSVSVYFLLTSVIPMVSVLEVAIRALIGTMVFGDVGELQMTMIAALIWFVNLVIPSLIGFVIWIDLNRKK